MIRISRFIWFNLVWMVYMCFSVINFKLASSTDYQHLKWSSELKSNPLYPSLLSHACLPYGPLFWQLPAKDSSLTLFIFFTVSCPVFLERLEIGSKRTSMKHLQSWIEWKHKSRDPSIHTMGRASKVASISNFSHQKTIKTISICFVHKRYSIL